MEEATLNFSSFHHLLHSKRKLNFSFFFQQLISFIGFFSLFSFIGWLRLPSSAFIQSKHFWIEWMAAGGESKQNNLFSSSIIHLWEWWKREIGLLSFNKLIDAPREKTINGKKSETHQSSFNSKNEEIDWASFLFFPRGSLQSTNWKCFICWWRSKAMAQPTNNNLFFFLTALARADKRREELLGLPRQLELPWCPAWWRRSTPFTNQIKLKFNLLLWIGSLHLRSLCFVLIDLNEFNWFCLFVCLLFAEHWARCGP